jgi:hypothetical protein
MIANPRQGKQKGEEKYEAENSSELCFSSERKVSWRLYSGDNSRQKIVPALVEPFLQRTS